MLLLDADSIDSRAATYLDRLDPNGDGTVEVGDLEREQVGESLERLVNIENVTEATVKAPINDRGSGAIIDRQVSAALDIMKTLTIEAVARGGGKILSGTISRLVEDDVIGAVTSKVDELAGGFSTTGRNVGRGTSQAADDQTRTFDELDSELKDDTLENADDPEDWIDEGTQGAIQGSLEPAADTFDAIDDTASKVTDTIEALEYQKYLDGGASGSVIDLLDDLAEFDPPSYELDVPDSVDIPVPAPDLANEAKEGAETAVNGLRGAIDKGFDEAANLTGEDDVNVYEKDGDYQFSNVPEEIEFDFLDELPTEIDFGELPGVEDIQELSDKAAELAAIPETAIDPSIDQLVERIVEDAENGELSKQSQANRETVLNIANTVIEAVTETADFALDQLKGLSDLVSDLSTLLAILTVIAAVLAFASTGPVGSAISVGALGALSVGLLAAQVLVDRARFLFAKKSVQTIAGTHSAAGALLTYSDLSEFGGGS